MASVGPPGPSLRPFTGTPGRLNQPLTALPGGQKADPEPSRCVVSYGQMELRPKQTERPGPDYMGAQKDEHLKARGKAPSSLGYNFYSLFRNLKNCKCNAKSCHSWMGIWDMVTWTWQFYTQQLQNSQAGQTDPKRIKMSFTVNSLWSRKPTNTASTATLQQTLLRLLPCVDMNAMGLGLSRGSNHSPTGAPQAPHSGAAWWQAQITHLLWVLTL